MTILHIYFDSFQGTEITSVIHQWKEMNCEADSINVMDQGRERETRATKAFWKALGGKKTIQGRDLDIRKHIYSRLSNSDHLRLAATNLQSQTLSHIIVYKVNL